MSEPGLTITLVDKDGLPENAAILKGLREYNESKVGKVRNHLPLTIFVKDEKGVVVGGMNADTAFGWLFIELFWIEESLRGKGLGKRLLQMAELEALKRGCRDAYLDTFDFQALPFYEKMGYRQYGKIEEFLPGHTRYFLQKRGIKAQDVADAVRSP